MMSQISWQQMVSFTTWDVVKVVMSAVIILLVSKIQLVSDRLSALLIALPLTSLLAMIWMHQEGQSSQRLANHAESTFWFVLPTLPMFLLLSWMLRHGWGFWSALAVNCIVTMICFWLTVFILRRFGMDLMPS